MQESMTPGALESAAALRSATARRAEFGRVDASAVSFRSFCLGLLFAVIIAFLNCWLMTVFGIGTLGGIQMAFGAVFLIMVLVGVNVLLRLLNKLIRLSALRVFSAVEMMTIYVMSLFAGMVSTPGTDNQFMTVGTGLFYFAKPENGWAGTFYKHIPTWWAPAFNGKSYDKNVVDKFYLGNVAAGDIPWQAWMSMLIGWSIFLLLIYAVLFFVSLLFRKQWIENEALSFPLIQIPLQMAGVDPVTKRGGISTFWSDKGMWLGMLAAMAIHSTVGLHNIYPEFPTFPVQYYGTVWISFADKPWNAMGAFYCSIFLGIVGISFLLSREVSFSFWFFFLLQKLVLVGTEMVGYPVGSLPKSAVSGLPTFMGFQSTGGWLGLGIVLIITARSHIASVFRDAFGGRTAPDSNEPFSARVIVSGLLVSLIGLFVWSVFAGISLHIAALFFGMFLLTSLVVSRLVVEGGLTFPQPSFSVMEVMTTGMIGANAIGAANITKLSFLQPSIFVDMRTNVLPGFLHTMKAAEELSLDRRGLRRLLMCAACAVVVGLAVSLATTLWSVYGKGGLAAYSWFTAGAPQAAFGTAATLINTKPGVDYQNVAWTGVGAGSVYLMMLARSRFLWFPLHPLGYIAAGTFPIGQFWFSFFLGWLIKSVAVKYGGSDGVARIRPFIMGIILGNVAAMIFWILIGLYRGAPMGYQAA